MEGTMEDLFAYIAIFLGVLIWYASFALLGPYQMYLTYALALKDDKSDELWRLAKAARKSIWQPGYLLLVIFLALTTPLAVLLEGRPQLLMLALIFPMHCILLVLNFMRAHQLWRKTYPNYPKMH